MPSRRPALWLMIAALPAVLTLAYLIPLLGVMAWSVTKPEFGAQNYVRVATDPLVLSVLARTFRICGTVTAVTLVLAFALAYLWTFSTRRIQVLAEACILIPLWISVLSRAFGWLAILSPKGILNGGLMAAGLIAEPLALVRNEFGVMVGMVHFLLPFAVLPIASALRTIDPRVLMAARGLGAGRGRVFRSVVLPLAVPGLLGSAAIVFVFALGFLITPAILGGGRSVMAAEFIQVQLFQTSNWGLAAALSTVLIVLVGLVLALAYRAVPPRMLAG